MADYPGQERSELNRLQQEAIRRAREMQARAQIPSARSAGAPPAPRRGSPGTAAQPDPQPPQAPPEPEAPPPPQRQPANVPSAAPREQPAAQPPAAASAPAGSFFGGISGSLDFLLKDSERSMLLILLLLLMEEKADTSLIFAIMYLLI